jgi:hypothetical protein
MKFLYCVVLLSGMSSVYGMQKKNKPHKKFNIHNVQKKNGKKNGSVSAKQKQIQELYQLNRAEAIKEREAGLLRETRILTSIFLGSPVLLYTLVTLDYHMRGVSCASLLNWCIDEIYSTTPF